LKNLIFEINEASFRGIKMRNKIVFWEFLLLFASVLVFRSIWMLLDRIPEMKNEFGLWALLILGTMVALIAILMINRYAEKRKPGRSPPATLAYPYCLTSRSF